MPNTVALFPQNYSVTNDPTTTLLNSGTNKQVKDVIGDGIPSAIEVLLKDLIDGFLEKLKKVTGIDLVALANSIIELPRKTWEFIKVDLLGLVIDLFTGQFAKFFGTIWRWVTNFVGITGHGGIIGTVLRIGQWIMGLFGTSHNGSTSLLGRVFNWLKRLIGPGISHFLATAWEIIGGVFRLFGGAGSGGGSAFAGIWNVLKRLWNWISGPFKGLWHLVQDVIKLFGGGTGASGSGLWNFVKTLWDKVAGFLRGAWNIVEGIFRLFGGGADGSSAFSGIWNVLKRLWNWIAGPFKGLWTLVSGVIRLFGGGSNGSSAFSGAWNVLKKLWNWVSGPFKGLWSLVQDIFKLFGGGTGGGGSFLSNTWNTLKKLWHKVAGWFGGIFSFAGGIFRLFSGGGSGGSAVSNIWHTVKKVWNRIIGFLIGAWRTVQTIWNWLTGSGSILGKARSMLSSLTTIKTRFGKTTVGGLVTDVASIVSNPAGGDKSLTQQVWSAFWTQVNCWGFVGKIFSFFHNLTGIFSNPTGHKFGSILTGLWNLLGLHKIAGAIGNLASGNVSAAFNFFGSPMSPGGLSQVHTLASDLASKAGKFLGLGDTSNTAGGLFGTTTRGLGDFMTVLGSPAGLGTGLPNVTMGPMLPPVNLYNSFGTLSPFHFGAMPAGAVASTPTHASNLVNEGAFRAAITVAEGQGWSYDDVEGRTIPGSLKVVADGAQNEMVANQIPTVSGQSYNLESQVKWSGLSYTGSDPIAIGITGYSYEPLMKTYTELESVDVATLSAPAASGGWTLIAGTYTVPGTATPDVVRFRLKIGGNLAAGSVWFDEVSAVSTDLVRDNVVPGIGTILDNGVNGLENLGGSGFGHPDFFSAMYGQNAAGISLATRVTKLETTAAPGTSGVDDFERTSSADLGTGWSLTYSGAGAGTWATPNGHDASWLPSGAGDREVLCRFTGTGATSTGDNQKTTAVLGSKAETDFFGGYAQNYLLGRVGSDMLNYILAAFGGNGYVAIIRCLAGVRTVLASTTVSGLSSGATIGLICGTVTGTRYFQALVNEQAVSFGGSSEVNDATSQFGGSFRGRGHGALAKGNFFSQLSPARYNSWAAIDL